MEKIKNFIFALARGDYPMWKSFFTYFILFNIISVFIGVMLLFIFPDYTTEQDVAINVWLYLEAVYFGVSAIGTWRSSLHYQGNKNHVNFVRVATIIICLICLSPLFESMKYW